jgi:hypothetical protein
MDCIPPTKLSKLKAAFAKGDHLAAIRIAANFPRLGDHQAAITRAWAAARNPNFYREIGQDPEALVLAGVDALREKYRL